ncbi:tetratricopeptide repeat protein [Burkholderia oklahomensis]|uniref:tetratricopeptide repeat protein n=2 Tax=Burkholderia oklahomensis TaxID=342113 RepID=UPI00016A7F42|nr:tetratricopeptide repeat protein [Burkholderia oklahomensis]AOI47055.1 hypothetical protein WI23_15435 [Burkholderia oklahomensis C6786]KUY59938.1 hypothetical protein WI23_15190 [Burkholderia oklahomensis C6786]MBI0360269.1 tetratricopeptide repeat protein [Burkholderia oklahomensis]SUW59654.1 Predicted O-linked N-acetylglucosamine transferase, SPINDLY family [Burkholderia oklahomensis]
MSSAAPCPNIPLAPPLVAMLRRALDAGGDARAIWLEAARLLHPVDDDAIPQLTMALVGAGRAGDAVELARLYDALAPASPAAAFNHGYALQHAGRHADAISPYRRVLAVAPAWPSLKNNLAIAVRMTGGDAAEELALLEGAAADAPSAPDAWINLVIARLRGRDLPGALDASAKALALAPDSPLALNNAAMAYKEAQRWDDAERIAARVSERDPDNASHRFNLALIHLARGDYAAGWPEHEMRWSGAPELRGKLPALPGPRWRGEPLAGKTLLVWGEQGMGDLLQFSRFVPALAERVHREGGRLEWNSFPQMGDLLVRSLGAHVDGYRAGGGVAELQPFDYEIPLMSVPWMLGLGDALLGDTVPYLRADDAAIAGWRERFAASAPAGAAPLRVGLAWTGSLAHQRNPFRRVGLDRYAAAFGGVGGVTFHSLQPGAAADIEAARAAGFPIVDETAELRTFDDTAAYVGALDLVVSVCTSVAHLSGALGRPTWVLLDVNPHWVWQLERRDSPWYPTATLYRQREFTRWEPVMEEAARDLREWARRAR